MNKNVLLYWPVGGSVEYVANKVAGKLQDKGIDVFNLGDFDLKKLAEYSNVFLCGSTVGYEMWDKAESNDKWGPFFYNIENDKIDVKNKKFALVGLGNQVMYPDHFADGMGNMRDEVEHLGGKLIGSWPSEGYDFMDSKAVDDEGVFCGLAIDEDNEFEMTDERIEVWLESIEKEF